MSDDQRRKTRPSVTRRRAMCIGGLAVGALLLAGGPCLGSAAEDAWTLLRGGGHVALIRHARAPGTGDPPGFQLGNCATQRNLSSEGRAQAVALGEEFHRRGVPVNRVLSSRWCRCLDTAKLAFGAVEPFEPLNSFFRNRALAESRTAAVRALIRDWPADGGTLVLITHQVNITALADVFPAEGEVLVLRAGEGGGIEVAGRIAATS